MSLQEIQLLDKNKHTCNIKKLFRSWDPAVLPITARLDLPGTPIKKEVITYFWMGVTAHEWVK